MSYGTPDWQGWVLDEQTSLEHIKYAYDLGINAFDTANVYDNTHLVCFSKHSDIVDTLRVAVKRSLARRSSNST